MKKILASAIVLGILFGLGVASVILESSKNSMDEDVALYSDEIKVNSFDSCVLAEYPVQESYPRRCTLPDGSSYIEDVGNIEYDMVLTTPRPNDIISSPIKIQGEAVGPWFFEASFTAELVDADGKSLGTAVLTAESEWMTKDLVPFSGDLTFDAISGEGELILKSANPSGIPESQKIFSIPVRLN